MDSLLREIKNIKSECCVTLILNTHRTSPDNQKDPILLKNLIKEVDERITQKCARHISTSIIKRLKKLSDSIDHSHNLESLVIFVNEEMADYTRLTVPVKSRVVIGETFATRDLVRALHEESTYYILVLSRQNARLIEAHNDKTMHEFSDIFPVRNDSLFTTDRLKLSTAKGTDRLIEEFFNRVDKLLQAAIVREPAPVLIATEERNFHHFVKVADRKEIILGHLNKNRDDEKAHHIVAEAWPVVHAVIIQRNQKRLQELNKAANSGKKVSDLNDIWTAINEGRGQTLFIKKGTFQPAIIEKGNIITVNKNENGRQNFIDDIIDEMIELNLKYGGEAVFIEGEGLDAYKGLVLLTRY
jgi:sporulation protein YlmC with PRC-barrel domain